MRELLFEAFLLRSALKVSAQLLLSILRDRCTNHKTAIFNEAAINDAEVDVDVLLINIAPCAWVRGGGTALASATSGEREGKQKNKTSG